MLEQMPPGVLFIVLAVTANMRILPDPFASTAAAYNSNEPWLSEYAGLHMAASL
jgi:hypothetical protein